MAGPLEQFVIKPIVPLPEVAGLDLSFTNSSLWMGLAVIASYSLVMLGTRHAELVPGRLQSIVELAYEFVASMIRENAGKEGMAYFPVIFTLFMFVLLGNTLGMIPGSFTFTSHIVVTFALAAAVFVGVTVLGFAKHGAKFATLFVPHGAPTAILPLLVPIEIISYCVRPISLSVRLFVNMVAGHTMLKVFATFALGLGVLGVAPLAVTVAITGLEFVIAFLQAYIFTVLTCIYLNDALHLH
ncbi:MAG: F0F1 ATP synthase subunit A [Alphaproteobacteria bacterium]|nr:F0F1 ATP synthase subunit A [Alphaproteobacteria bacterium]